MYKYYFFQNQYHPKLLYKTVYENKLFKEITIDLEISKECLEIRLFHLLKDYSNLNNKEISTIVSNFQRNKNQTMNLALYDIKHNIISEYEQITPNNLEKATHQLNKSYLISSLDFIELTDNTFQEKLRQSNPIFFLVLTLISVKILFIAGIQII
ncbi:TPA: hypothetical protein ACJRVV_001153 [Streptococcus agalactiae]